MVYLSIIIPSFNSGKFIAETLDSVCVKTNHDLQIIVVDGDSNDDTLNILNKYNDRIDLIISEPDDGQTNAIKKGFQNANGKYIRGSILMIRLT